MTAQDDDIAPDDIYMICPFCRKVARNSWSDRELSDWTRRHIEQQACRK